MKPEDLIKVSIYEGAIRGGATRQAARDYSIAGVDRYRKNQFRTAQSMVTEQIKAAVKFSKEIAKKKKP